MPPDLALLDRMRQEWDSRARENGRYYIANCREDWTEEEFYRSGEQTVREEILTDMYNICQGKPPEEMRVLEIGCGAGRVTRALSAAFGEVHAVDVSGEMVAQARLALAGRPNAFVHQNSGTDLAVLGDRVFDFAFSTCVFHHIGSREVIETYVSEVHRLLRPGGLFKFEVQGFLGMTPDTEGTWFGLPFSDEDAVALAAKCGFEPRHRVGAGEERFWLWFFKQQ